MRALSRSLWCGIVRCRNRKQRSSMFRSVNLLRVVPLSACVVTLLSLSRGYGQPSTLPSSTSSWAADATGLRLHMSGNAHIDAVWLWTWPEADAVAHSTFRSALDRLNEDPEI